MVLDSLWRTVQKDYIQIAVDRGYLVEWTSAKNHGLAFQAIECAIFASAESGR
jgi:hypothetical protein